MDSAHGHYDSLSFCHHDDIYSNGGSPTAATSSVMAVSALAAHEGRSVGTVDFPSAFLNCDMPEGSESIHEVR